MNWAEYDNVRFALGLESVKTAAIKGQKITSNIRVAIAEGNDDTNALDGTESSEE